MKLKKTLQKMKVKKNENAHRDIFMEEVENVRRLQNSVFHKIKATLEDRLYEDVERGHLLVGTFKDGWSVRLHHTAMNECAERLANDELVIKTMNDRTVGVFGVPKLIYDWLASEGFCPLVYAFDQGIEIWVEW